MKVSQSCPTLRPHGLYTPWNSPGQNTGVGSCFLLQGIFLTQGLNLGLPHCRHILYQLSHKRSLYKHISKNKPRGEDTNTQSMLQQNECQNVFSLLTQ